MRIGGGFDRNRRPLRILNLIRDKIEHACQGYELGLHVCPRLVGKAVGERKPMCQLSRKAYMPGTECQISSQCVFCYALLAELSTNVHPAQPVSVPTPSGETSSVVTKLQDRDTRGKYSLAI